MTATTVAERARPAGGTPSAYAVVAALILVAAAATALLPLWSLLLAPIVLGVPHVIGDLRVLVLQQPDRARRVLATWVLAPLLVLTALRLAAMAGLAVPAELEPACGMLAVLLGVALGGRAGGRRRAPLLAAMIAVGGVGALAVVTPRATSLVLAHAHNLVAFGVWLWWARPGRRGIAAGGLYVAALAVVVGAPGAFAAGGDAAIGAFRWSTLAHDLAPGLAAPAADAVVRSFAFAQAVHYGLWLWVLPRRRGSSLRTEAGTAAAALCLALCALVPAAALLDAPRVRATYLSLVVFHGWLEFAAIAFLLASRGRGAPAC